MNYNECGGCFYKFPLEINFLQYNNFHCTKRVAFIVVKNPSYSLNRRNKGQMKRSIL